MNKKDTTATGRFISSENLSNRPKEIGEFQKLPPKVRIYQKLRDAFTTPAESLITDMDFSAVEMRIAEMVEQQKEVVILDSMRTDHSQPSTENQHSQLDSIEHSHEHLMKMLSNIRRQASAVSNKRQRSPISAKERAARKSKSKVAKKARKGNR